VLDDKIGQFLLADFSGRLYLLSDIPFTMLTEISTTL